MNENDKYDANESTDEVAADEKVSESGDPGRTQGKAEGGDEQGKTGDPGRTPGSAEGEDDPEETGGQ